MRTIYPCLLAALALLASFSNADAQYYITNAVINQDTGCTNIGFADVTTNVYAAGQQIEISWGDASVSTLSANDNAGQGFAYSWHSYSLTGTYTVKYVLINAAQRVDSVMQSFNDAGCHRVSVSSYNDLNANCVYDLGDIPNYSSPLTFEVDSNNIPVATITSSGLFFKEYGPVGTVYKYIVTATPPGITVSCPLTGMVTDTVTNNANQNISKSFGLTCAPAANFDLAENVAVCVGQMGGYMHIDLTNTDCNGTNATLVLNYSPKLHYSNAFPTPANVAGNTITWNFPVASIYPQYVTVSFDTPLVALNIGDTVHSSFYLTPTAGDMNVANNTVIRVDTIHAAYDPNFKDVSPQGDITAGTVLTYTVSFENTGNDTAMNIYVLDTLSDNLLPNTFSLVASTAEVQTQVVPYGAGHHLLKFDFPNINLPDSSHHGLCDGMIVFRIQTKPTLTPGTYITNRAGIYFDVNPVIMTNQVVNKVHVPDGVEILDKAKVAIYPNPVTDILTITTDERSYNAVEITNTVGQLMLKQPLKQNNTRINVRALPSGIYFANLKGEVGNKTIKFEKL